MSPRSFPSERRSRSDEDTFRDLEDSPPERSDFAPRHRPRRRRNPLLAFIGSGFLSVFFMVRLLVLCALVFGLTAGVSYMIVRRAVKGKDVAVPALAGYNVQEAMKILSNTAPELSLKLSGMEYSNMVDEGQVVSQLPAPGSHVKAGSNIRVVVSKGNSKVSCPDVTHMQYQDAGITLRKAGLTEGNHSFVNDVSVKKDFVISQDPAPKAELDKQTAVNLLISKGAPSQVIQMPDLVNGTVEEAQVVLKGLGLQMPQVTEEARPDMNNGMIVSQSPAAGTVMNPEDLIAVTVVNNIGAGEASTDTPELTTGSGESALPPMNDAREQETKPAPADSEVPSLDDVPSDAADPEGN